MKEKEKMKKNADNIVHEHYHVVVVLASKYFTVAFGPNRVKANEFIGELNRVAGKGKIFEIKYRSFPSGETNSICINPALFAGAYPACETIRTKINLDGWVAKHGPKKKR